MQPRLNLRSKNSSTLLSTSIKGLVIVALIILAFYLLDKVDFPSPQSETKENVTNQTLNSSKNFITFLVGLLFFQNLSSEENL